MLCPDHRWETRGDQPPSGESSSSQTHSLSAIPIPAPILVPDPKNLPVSPKSSPNTTSSIQDSFKTTFPPITQFYTQAPNGKTVKILTLWDSGAMDRILKGM